MAYEKPTSVMLSPYVYTGRASDGCTIDIEGNANYPYVYVCPISTTTTWKYYPKGELNGSGATSIEIDKNTSTNEYEIAIVLSDTYYGDNVGVTISNSYADKLYEFTVPLYAALIHNASSSSDVYDSIRNNLSTTFTKSGYTLQGFSTSSTGTTATYGTSWVSGMNGKELYAVYKKNSSSSTKNYTYYLGNNSSAGTISKITTTSGIVLYGTGSSTSGTTNTSWSGTPSTSDYNSSYKFLGWAKNATTTVNSTNYKTACNNSSGTIYAVYGKDESMTYYPQNGNSSSSVSITNYRYGPGYTTNNAPTEPSLTYNGYTFSGWSTASNGTINTWVNQWNSGVRTVYAIWVRDGNIYYCPVGKDNWISSKTYKGAKVNGVLQWVPIQMKYGDNNIWN